MKLNLEIEFGTPSGYLVGLILTTILLLEQDLTNMSDDIDRYNRTLDVINVGKDFIKQINDKIEVITGADTIKFVTNIDNLSRN